MFPDADVEFALTADANGGLSGEAALEIRTVVVAARFGDLLVMIFAAGYELGDESATLDAIRAFAPTVEPQTGSPNEVRVTRAETEAVRSPALQRAHHAGSAWRARSA